MEKKIALVTGANKGIGFEIARGLLAAGAKVYIGARDKARGEAAAKELGASFVQLDVTSEASIKSAAAEIQKAEGRLDILVNNAGVALESLPPSATTMKALRDTFETNYFGVVAVTQAMLPLLKAGKHKSIVNVSSGLGSISMHGLPDWEYDKVNILAYNSSKAALNMFTVLLAKELLADGFRVNSINPGYVATDLNGQSGPGTPAEGASIAISTALAGPDARTGSFITKGGIYPW